METCGLYIDLPPKDLGPVQGDFILTVKRGTRTPHWIDRVGSVYIIESARKVQRRKPSQKIRYQLRCFRSTREDFCRAVVDEEWKKANRYFRFQWYKRG